MRQGISLHRILSFQYSSTFVQWLIKELLNIILAWQYHLVAGLGTEVLTQGRLPLPVPALGLAVPRGRHRPDKRSKLISTTINVNRINQSFKCAIKIIRVDTWNLNVSSFSFTSSTCWYDKEDQHRIYLRPPHTLVFVILCLYLRIPGGDESGKDSRARARLTPDAVIHLADPRPGWRELGPWAQTQTCATTLDE